MKFHFLKTTVLVGLIALLAACNTQPEKAAEQPTETNEPIEDNAELMELHDNDQLDRKKSEVDWDIVNQRDSARRQRVYEMLEANKVRTAKDHYHAAMVFQHGHDSVAYGMAVKLIKTAVEMDSTINKWLFAAATDRYLLSIGKPQIYGTQFGRQGDEPWSLSELDSTQITDEERMEHGVPPLNQLKERVRKMNLRTLSMLLAEEKSVDEIIAFIQSEDREQSNYDLSESGINSFGYQLMADERLEDALQILKLNTELFPEGFNTYDSYGECLLLIGRIDEGIEAYRKSLELNPENTHAADLIQAHSNTKT